MITTRQRKILRRLINNANPEFGKNISKHYEISSRTLRSDIAALNNYLSEQEVLIHSSPREGYWISDEDKKKLAAYLRVKNSQRIQYPDDPSEREIYIYFRLLFSPKPISLNQIANEIFISPTTIMQDVNNMKDLIRCIHGVQLKVDKKSGMHFEGEEGAIRKLISSIILYYFEAYANFLTYSIQVFSDKRVHILYNLLINCFNQQNFLLAQKSMKMLCMEISLFIERKKIGYELSDYPYHNTSHIVLPVQEINDLFHTQLNDYDLDVIFETLKFKKIISTEESILYKNQDHEDIIQQYFEDINKEFGIDLSNEIKIRSHIRKTLATVSISRNRIEMDIADIEILNPLAYEIALRFNPICQDRLSITPSSQETRRLALRIAIVLDKYLKPVNIIIHTGSATYSEYLLYSVKKYFPETLNVLGAYDEYQIKDVCMNKQVDLILSTVALEDTFGADILYVQPVLRTSHIATINNYLQKHHRSIKNQKD